jgi:hypothetical protein
MYLYNRLVQMILGASDYPTGSVRIRTIRHALLWQLGALPGLDADVRADGSVRLFRR